MTIANIYAQSISSMNGRVRAYVDFLDENGQVDRDANSDPIVTRMDPVQPNNWRVFFLRNGYEENFLMNPRKRTGENGVVEPIRKTWNPADGFRRVEPMRQKIAQDMSNPRAERSRRDYPAMVEALLDVSRPI